MSMDLKGKNIAVIGMGRTGIATAGFLVRRGARVTLLDQKSENQLRPKLPNLDPAVHLVFGTSRPPAGTEVVVLSPGTDINAPFLDEARQRGVEIISEIELAFRFNRVPVLAITGTNGKSTVTTLVGEILKEAGKQVDVGGNLGTPFIEFIDGETADYRVLEISSFQLEGVSTFHPKVAAILNLTPDHLDRHRTMAQYGEFKRKIAANQTQEDFLVLNLDDPETVKLGRGTRPGKLLFSTRQEVAAGAFLKGNTLVTRFGGDDRDICTTSDLQPAMRWQVENVLAALATACPLGLDAQPIARALRNFSGLEHRMEWVRRVREIDFVNDSKGTNVGSVLKSLSSFDRPVVLILGGRDKDGDFSLLGPLFKSKTRFLVLIGEAREKIRKVLNGSPPFVEAETLEEAVGTAIEHARPGDVVLLSPACASFDMFQDYADRGRQFKSIVNRLEES